MAPLPEGLENILGAKTVEKLYDDALSPIAKEIGKIGGDVGKTARLLLAPLQIGATLQDRLKGFLERAAKRVPDERKIAPPAEVVGPSIEHMRWLDEASPLWKMFKEVLTRSMDKDLIHEVHPSFVSIIKQLSRDEAVILLRLRSRPFDITDTLDLNATANRFENRKVEQSGVPIGDLYVPEKFDLSYAHLESLGLAAWPVERQDPIFDSSNKQTGIRRFSKILLTNFGEAFVRAAIPEKGF